MRLRPAMRDQPLLLPSPLRGGATDSVRSPGRGGFTLLVPTLRVGTPGAADPRRLSGPRPSPAAIAAERQDRRSHAERGNEWLSQRAARDGHDDRPSPKRGGAGFCPRRAFTLVELLVVIGLILALATLLLLISPRLAEDQRSARTADLVSGHLLSAKQMARRDGQTRGVRLLVDPANHVRELQFVERPEDYRGGSLICPSPHIHPSDPANRFATVFVDRDLTNSADPGSPIVEPGDFLVFDNIESPPYNAHRIYLLQWRPELGGTHIILGVPPAPPPPAPPPPRPSPVSTPIPPPGLDQYQFHFVRRPRPLVGEPNLQLPRDMVIDLDSSTPGPSSLPGFGNADGLDILFSPRGQLEGSNAILGKVVLRVRNGTRAPDDGDQLYVVVYTRSGVITTHPVNFTPDASGFVDYYLFLKDGGSSGY